MKVNEENEKKVQNLIDNYERIIKGSVSNLLSKYLYNSKTIP